MLFDLDTPVLFHFDPDSKAGTRSLSRMGSRQSQREPVPAEPSEPEPEEAPVEYAERDDGGRSWTLEHVSEIVYLATQTQMSTQIKDSLAAFEAGDRLALEVRMFVCLVADFWGSFNCLVADFDFWGIFNCLVADFWGSFNCLVTDFWGIF